MFSQSFDKFFSQKKPGTSVAIYALSIRHDRAELHGTRVANFDSDTPWGKIKSYTNKSHFPFKIHYNKYYSKIFKLR
jgi:hypothetical protein